VVAAIIATKVVVTPALCGMAAATIPATTPIANPHQPDSSHDVPRIPAPAAIRVARPGAGVCRAGTSTRRFDGHHAARSSAAIIARPTTIDHRYSESNRYVRSTRPDAPSGTIHPCCHPSTTTGDNSVPSSRAIQPGLVDSGTTRRRSGPASTSTTRWVAPHSATVGTDVVAGVSGSCTSDTASTVNASPGLTATS